ncbi:MDR family MFS transporter [Salisediminibacterium halotolerans]|uniref:MDR family MFS transporter n=1 Tax=Salisediminibacterium halotolerans TaxID=517425 RepID=UPI000EB44974|nr:MDR family MFS transporter [Salisediminibacterium halotolerans]RLJ71641.1 EmrB/QacA subfamily drug resistance transporter [Actinophytocola xinjiangensis]RPE86791.1 EmrB/QacA subfamily drug resistance transporter [Salisediminibacterium halotolerans]TWG32854.1 EmrB/QacA subfamily drug resistance transporter [Salisediminibacterium halotolerans]GEL06946.1 MFS transporter [Salisediminibacterium halotolerans]
MQKIPDKWLVVITVLLGAFTVILNNSMLNPAVPHFMAVFQADAVAAGWVITVFMVTMGMAMPLTGYLADKYGKKQMYISGMALFISGSVFGSLSWDLSSLIMFRGLQGLGGGLIMPLSMALIFDAFPRNERGLATGIYGIAAMMAPTIGPTLGGVIIELAAWQWLFLMNIPIGAAGLLFAVRYLPQSRTVPEIRFDLPGFITVTAGVGAVLTALGRISELAHLMNPVNIGLVILGAGSIALFIRIETKQQQPLLDLSIFRIRAYTYSVWVAIIGSMSLFGGIFLIPLLIQNVYGYGAIMTGLVFLPAALLTGVFMTVGGRLLDKQGPTVVVTTGLTLLTLGTGLMGFLDMTTSLWLIFLLNAIRGVGMGLSNMPATTAGMNSIPEAFVSRGSAMNNVMRQMSSALGIVFVSVYFEVRRAQLMNGESLLVEEASLAAINEGFIVLAVISLLSIPAGLLLGREYQKSSDADEKGE